MPRSLRQKSKRQKSMRSRKVARRRIRYRGVLNVQLYVHKETIQGLQERLVGDGDFDTDTRTLSFNFKYDTGDLNLYYETSDAIGFILTKGVTQVSGTKFTKQMNVPDDFALNATTGTYLRPKVV